MDNSLLMVLIIGTYLTVIAVSIVIGLFIDSLRRRVSDLEERNLGCMNKNPIGFN